MSMEDIVRERHKLEDRVTRFLAQIDDLVGRTRTMETRDIEVCMAKLYDLMTAATDESIKLDRLFKGLLVKSIYDKRKSGEKMRSSFWNGRAFPPEIVDYKFAYPVPITENLANEWGAGGSGSVRRLITP